MIRLPSSPKAVARAQEFGGGLIDCVGQTHMDANCVQNSMGCDTANRTDCTESRNFLDTRYGNNIILFREEVNRLEMEY